MNQKNFALIFLLHGLLIGSPSFSQKELSISWSKLTELPVQDSLRKQPGLAGAFAGISENVLLIAGGANFPNAMPWDGGKKVYWDDIYVFIRKANRNFGWYTHNKFKLPQRIAYGASVSTEQGIVCIGGENENRITKSVFKLGWDSAQKRVSIKKLPELPLAITNTAAVVDKKIIYVAGGETINHVSDRLFALDLDKISEGWQELHPIPKPISHAVMVVQSNANGRYIYLIGGRKKNADGISELYNSVFAFDVLKNHWSEKRSLPYSLSAGTGVALGLDKILVFGGDRGETFHKTEELISEIKSEKDETRKEALLEQKNKLQKDHPGFSREILIYDTVKDQWGVLGKMPFNTPATTTAVKWENDVIIPSGEIRAGVRTPMILLAKLIYKK